MNRKLYTKGIYITLAILTVIFACQDNLKVEPKNPINKSESIDE